MTARRIDMPLLLSLSLRIRPVRRLLARMRWPRPEHLDRLNKGQFHSYVRAIGLEAEARAALADYRQCRRDSRQ